MITLLHGSFEWIMAGIVVFAGIMVFLRHVAAGDWLNVFASGCVWFFVYKIHGGISTNSIMTATFAAMLFDIFGLRLLMKRK